MTTAYCYDPIYLEHNLWGHPENRTRLERLVRVLAEEGLLQRMVAVTASPVAPDLLARVHTRPYISLVRDIAQNHGGYLDLDTYVVPASYDAALAAAGGCANLIETILAGRAQNGIALVRPPGHHATSDQGMGFCLFNNIAVAARAALDRFGLERILIVDWDVHHGNGTQDIFYDSSQVLFFSTHQYPHYPGSGHWIEAGTGPGQGYTVNVPLAAGMGDAAMGRIYNELLTPLAERFRPELILVSAGYDAHWADPLAGLQLTLSGYWQMAQHVCALADRLCAGRLLVVLEGGYHLQVLACGVADTCRALLGDPNPGDDPLGLPPEPEPPADDLLRAVRQITNLEHH